MKNMMVSVSDILRRQARLQAQHDRKLRGHDPSIPFCFVSCRTKDIVLAIFGNSISASKLISKSQTSDHSEVDGFALPSLPKRRTEDGKLREAHDTDEAWSQDPFDENDPLMDAIHARNGDKAWNKDPVDENDPWMDAIHARNGDKVPSLPHSFSLQTENLEADDGSAQQNSAVESTQMPDQDEEQLDPGFRRSSTRTLEDIAWKDPVQPEVPAGLPPPRPGSPAERAAGFSR
eukprot:s3265_g3.t1